LRRVVLAPDKFKGSASALEAARALERGLRSVWGDALEARIVPMADGGEGTVDAFVASGARRLERTVPGPLGTAVTAPFALDGTRAIVEIAAASGLSLLAEGERDPLHASTEGTGALLRAALDAGARTIVVALGGSATNDGGSGMLRALGMRFLDAGGAELPPGGAALARLERIDASGLDPRLRDVTFEVAADVDSPLCGANGASALYGPQKGASSRDVAELDAALARFAFVTAKLLRYDASAEPGSGAAGGLGFAMRAFLGARLRPGVDVIADVRGLGAALDGANLCLTGEGAIDQQTLRGKTVYGVARRARAFGVPVIAFAGRIGAAAEAALAAQGAVAVPILDGPMTLAQAKADCTGLLERAAARTARLLG
jgi:glycerate kinase